MQFLSTYLGDNKLLQFSVLFAALAIAIIVTVLLVRLLFARRLRAPGGRGRQARLGIVDAFDLDRHRQLVLIRRDNIEHLIMIGGPNDLVIEASIMRAQTALGLREKDGQTAMAGQTDAPRLAAAATQPPVAPASPPQYAPGLPAEPRNAYAEAVAKAVAPIPRMPFAPVVLAPPESADRRPPPPAPARQAPPPPPARVALPSAIEAALRNPPALPAAPQMAPRQAPPPMQTRPPVTPLAIPPQPAPQPPAPPQPVPPPAIIARPPPLAAPLSAPVPAPQPTSKPAPPAQAAAGDPFDSLEAEMAKLLGR